MTSECGGGCVVIGEQQMPIKYRQKRKMMSVGGETGCLAFRSDLTQQAELIAIVRLRGF